MNTLRLSLKLLAGALLGLVLLVTALWFWSGSNSSLATLLSQLQRFLPAGQSLQVKDVQGSLRSGGHIGWLRWSQGKLSLEAHHVALGWTLRPLLDGHLQLNQLTINTLDIADQRTSNTTASAPNALQLPLTVEMPFSVTHVNYAGSTSWQATEVAGHYIYDSYSHILHKGKGRISSANYQLSGQLQAAAPMALSLELQGLVHTSLPSSSQPLAANAQAQLSGTLAGPDAALTLQATLRPELPSGPAPRGTQAPVMQASLSAQIHPWHAQPLTQASAQWWGLNLAAFWPQAPLTQLTGTASVTPQGKGWQGSVKLANTLAGPWNLQRLPLQALQTDVTHAHGQWGVNALLAKMAGGTVSGSGKFTGGQWQGQGSLNGVNPAGMDSRLASVPMNGTLQAQQTTQGLNFSAQLQATSPSAALPHTTTQTQGSVMATLRLHSLQASGVWAAPLLTLSSLTVQAEDARVTGRLSYHAVTQATQGQLALTLPGMQGSIDGHLARDDGQGSLSIKVLDAALATHWLSQWPQVANLLPPGSLTGAADLAASWQGGWQNQGRHLKLDAALQAPQITWVNPPTEPDKSPSVPWQLRGVQANVSGTLEALQLSTHGQLVAAEHQLGWQMQGSAGQLGNGQWQTKGSLSHMPLAWLDALGIVPMEKLGMRSTMTLNGQWDATLTDTLSLRASLTRSGGDLKVRMGDGPGPFQTAGVREAELNVTLEAGDLNASLGWASAQAGQANILLRTRLLQQGHTWRWAPDAPLSGTMQLHMPPIDAWSAFAPPGWRLRGTLDANATLSGTRALPQWQGTLKASDLAVRSVADGIDFQRGTLTARLNGQRLGIEEFTVFGAGTEGGQLKITGEALWNATTKPDAAMASRLHLVLGAQATALRLSTRSDRLVTVSGKLSAQLKDTLLTLRGKLTADQALISLPSESAPTLGDDVVVRRPAPSANLTPPNKPPTPFNTDVQLTLDLGNSFQVSGRGLDTRLAGSVELRANGSATPSLAGTLRTSRGTYLAYGQRLDIEHGLLRFTGPPDNPSLDILAIRPKLTQRVGVQVYGTALSPVVRLYAEPDLPEAEKLAWLVMGRSASGGGGETALLQQAALALLGGNGKSPSASLSQALGLDEFSFHGNTGDTATAATLTVGKRLSRDFYVAYESGLAGTMGVFSIFYDLSRRLTLRAKTGEQTAIDLIWTQRYD